VQIAAHHAEGQGVAAGEDVEEGLLFYGVALHAGDVAEGDFELAVVIVANFANAALAGADQAAMAASEAANAVTLYSPKLGRTVRGVLVEQHGEGRIGKRAFHGWARSGRSRCNHLESVQHKGWGCCLQQAVNSTGNPLAKTKK
jgi:hypothetical protein